MKKIYLLIFSTILLLPLQLMSQEKSHELLTAVMANLDKVAGFEANALIKVDVDFINIKDREVKVRFTSPDKFEFDTKGLALLPKNGVQMEYMSIIRNPYTAIDMGAETIHNTSTEIIKIIPESIDSDIILAQLWIDPQTARILRMKTFTRASGSYLINFFFPDKDSPLPNRLEVSFEIENMNFLPGAMMNDIMKEGKIKVDTLPKQARVIVEYRNLQITKKHN
ncbi:MAG: hypothetical protein J7L96_04450 [Bacteroidales bacterium]|nr:hypothetical protein [Bacteroidales bacterium]